MWPILCESILRMVGRNLGIHPQDTIQRHVTHWFRFIDDIVFMWLGPKQDCLGFITSLNNNSFNIFLTATISDSSVDFLDLSLCLQHNKIITRLHRKKTATNSLLHYSSHHPMHLKRGIPVGQFLRVRRNCSDTGDFISNAQDLTRRFINRSYPKWVVSQAFQRARGSDRKELLNTRVKKDTPRYITNYITQWNDLKQILKRHWDV